MRVRGVLLDMGGVILDMGNPQGLPTGRLDWRGRQALVRYFRRRGSEASLDDLERLLFAPWQSRYPLRYELGREARWEPHLARLRRAVGSRAHNLTLLAVWFRPYAEHLQPVEGAAAALAELAGMGLRLALVSNVPLPGKLYLRVLDNHRLSRVIESFHFSYDEGSRKPSPVMLRAACRALDLRVSDAVMVGDRPASDVAAGRAAGTWTVRVRSEHSGGPSADAEIRSIAELPQLLAEAGPGA